MSRFVLERIAKSNHAEPNAISEILGTLRTIFETTAFQAD